MPKETYYLTVRVKRSYSDDKEVVARKYPDLPFKDGAIRQFVDELQDAYVCHEGHGLAGHFEVIGYDEGSL